MLPTALVIQCFNKPDTLRGVCESLLRCSGIDALSVIFWCDSPVSSRDEPRYTPAHKEVCAYLDEFQAESSSRFQSLEQHHNPTNLGVYATCRLSIDYALARHAFAIFVEDDVVFSRDALLWFDAIRRQGLLAHEQFWAIAGESIFFNAQDKSVPKGWPEEMRDLAVRDNLVSYYCAHNFLPSTCFATTPEKWREFGETRGQVNGDVEVCTRCAAEKRFGIFPVVPRVKDVGMLHDLGYSVSIHTKAGVGEIKNTYVLAEDVLGEALSFEGPYSALTEGGGEIYAQTTLLKRLG